VQLSGYAVNGAVLLATFASIENAVGSGLDDALIGNAGNNRITGGAGSDWLVGGGGDDWFAQSHEAGVDRLFGDVGIDTIDYSASGAAIVVQLSGYSTSAGVTLATFNGIENAVGSAFNDALVGSASDNALTGGAGADWLVGGAGADRFVYDAIAAGVDTVADFSRTQGDRIDFSGIDASASAGDQAFALSTGPHVRTRRRSCGDADFRHEHDHQPLSRRRQRRRRRDQHHPRIRHRHQRRRFHPVGASRLLCEADAALRRRGAASNDTQFTPQAPPRDGARPQFRFCAASRVRSPAARRA
jgi:hypothetical protein